MQVDVGAADDDEKRAIVEARAEQDEAMKPDYAPGGLRVGSGAEAGDAGPRHQKEPSLTPGNWNTRQCRLAQQSDTLEPEIPTQKESRQ